MIYFPLSAALAALAAAVGADRLARRGRRGAASRWRSSRRTWPGTPRTSSRRCSTPPTTPTGRACALDPLELARLLGRAVRCRRADLLRRLSRRARRLGADPRGAPGADVAADLRDRLGAGAARRAPTPTGRPPGTSRRWCSASRCSRRGRAGSRPPSPSTSRSPRRCRSPRSSPTAGGSARQPGAGALCRPGGAQPARGRDRAGRGPRHAGLPPTAALLADFFYTLRDTGLAIYAEPADGFPAAPLRAEVPAAARPRRRALHRPRRRRPGMPQRVVPPPSLLGSWWRGASAS